VSRGRVRVLATWIAWALLIGATDPVLVGRVVEDASARPVAGAEVRVADALGRTVARAVTGEDGRFSTVLRAGGAYRLTAYRVGYAPSQPARVSVADGDTAAVVLRLEVAPVALDEVRAGVRRRTALHEPTVAGALARRLHFPRAGSRRVLLPADAEFRGATRVSDVLRWLPGTAGCMIVFLDGRVQSSPMAAVRLDGFADDVLAIEWYRRWQDAPLGLRDHPPEVREPFRCSVVALWTR